MLSEMFFLIFSIENANDLFIQMLLKREKSTVDVLICIKIEVINFTNGKYKFSGFGRQCDI